MKGRPDPVPLTLPAITLVQPWASLILGGVKTIETRTTGVLSGFRGPIVICTSRKPPDPYPLQVWPGLQIPDPPGSHIATIPHGHAVGVAWIGDTWKPLSSPGAWIGDTWKPTSSPGVWDGDTWKPTSTPGAWEVRSWDGLPPAEVRPSLEEIQALQREARFLNLGGRWLYRVDRAEWFKPTNFIPVRGFPGRFRVTIQRPDLILPPWATGRTLERVGEGTGGGSRWRCSSPWCDFQFQEDSRWIQEEENDPQDFSWDSRWCPMERCRAVSLIPDPGRQVGLG